VANDAKIYESKRQALLQERTQNAHNTEADFIWSRLLERKLNNVVPDVVETVNQEQEDVRQSVYYTNPETMPPSTSSNHSA
jgi:hypothetical protein